MGEAKRRAAEIARTKEQDTMWLEWRAGLDSEEQQILQLAERLDERLVRGKRYCGGCYHLAFFMTRYLGLRGVRVTPVIGWVTDGRWPGVSSHAWIEFEGRKTDASLTYTEFPDKTPTGALLVADHVVRPGATDYRYFKNEAREVKSALEWMRAQPELASTVRFKEAEHRMMAEIVQHGRIDTHLSKAPPGMRYADLATLVM